MPTLTRSPEAISGTSSATRPPARLFEPSPYALASSPDGLPGEWGGIALKGFPVLVKGQRVELQIGDRIPAELSRAWPIPNRLAMQSARMVRYFETAEEAGETAQSLADQARTNPERAMMAAETVADKRPARPQVQVRSLAQQRRLATIAAKKAARQEAAAAAFFGTEYTPPALPAPAAADEAQSVA
ncbi:MAG: hypothetical protein KGL39_03260 [Patescibacteria group bacterium]|nr:hypothetical protein [Patescibacteria group bacterium]